MKACLVKDRQRMAQHMIAPHATVTELMKIEGHGHKLYMDIYFAFPELFDDSAKKHLLLWDCQAKQVRHPTRPGTEDDKTEKERHFHKNQG